jgi:uridylate kinase
MSNTRAGSVIRVDTNAGFDTKFVKSIKYIGNASGTAIVSAGQVTGGNKLWEESGTSNVMNSDLDIYDGSGIFVTLTNGAIIYIYTE